jgi:DNA-binding protein
MFERIKNWVMAAIAIAVVTQFVRPSNTVKIIEAQGAAMSGMIKTMTAVRERSPSAVDMVLAMGTEEQKELYESLQGEDLEWLTQALRDT